MLQFLNPIWFFGIGGILIPVIIHLWNIKNGRTLKVGSTTLMGESSRQNSRSLKLMELLLLFLRCLLIILLSLLLAEPVWRTQKDAGENKDWILIEKENLKEVYGNFKKEIDSLTITGAELHFFEPGFKKVELKERLKDTTQSDSIAHLSYWSLFRLLDERIPQGSKAFIFTSDRANRFRGPRPNAAREINWKTFTPADSTAKWINHSYLSSTGNIRAIMSESSPQSTSTITLDISPGDENSGVKTSIAKGKPQVMLNEQTLIADTSTLTIVINSQGFPNDAGYLRAAIGSIQKFTARKIKIVSPSSGYDMIFWLSEKPLPGDIKAGSKVFHYAKGKAVASNSWLMSSNDARSLKADVIALHKRISYPEKSNAFPIWEDGFGEPLLELKKTNNIEVYTFYSRFDPSWTELVWNPAFVELLMPLVIAEESNAPKAVSDKRSIQLSQVLPQSDLIPNTSKKLDPVSLDIQHYFWLLLIMVFFIERFLSFRNSQQQ